MVYACTTFGLFVFFPGVFLSSRVTGACPVNTDLIMRDNVRTTIALPIFVVQMQMDSMGGGRREKLTL